MIIDSSLEHNPDMLFYIPSQNCFVTYALQFRDKDRDLYYKYFYWIQPLKSAKELIKTIQQIKKNDKYKNIQADLYEANRIDLNNSEANSDKFASFIKFKTKIDNAIAEVILEKYFKLRSSYSDSLVYIGEPEKDIYMDAEIKGREFVLESTIPKSINFPNSDNCKFDVFMPNNVKPIQEIKCGVGCSVSVSNSNLLPKISGTAFKSIILNHCIFDDKEVVINSDAQDYNIRNVSFGCKRFEIDGPTVIKLTESVIKSQDMEMIIRAKVSTRIDVPLNSFLGIFKDIKTYSLALVFDGPYRNADGEVNRASYFADIEKLEAVKISLGILRDIPVNLRIKTLIIPPGSKELVFDYHGNTSRSADVTVNIDHIEFDEDSDIKLDIPALMKVFYKGVRLQRNKRLKDQVVRQGVIVDKQKRMRELAAKQAQQPAIQPTTQQTQSAPVTPVVANASNPKAAAQVMAAINASNGNNTTPLVDLGRRLFTIKGKISLFGNAQNLANVIKNHNGRLDNHITNKLAYMICNDVNSSSAHKACEVGVMVISEVEFSQMIGGVV